MAKLVLTDLTSLASEPSAVQTINANFQLIAEVFDSVVSRDGAAPNQMEAPLDLNSQPLINLRAPQGANEAARLKDVQESLVVSGIPLPPLETGKALTNDGDALFWADVSALPGVGDMLAAQNLGDLTDVAAARLNLGLTPAATTSIGTSGAVFGLLSTNNTYSGANTHSGLNTFTGGATFGGTAEYRLTGSPTSLSADSLGFRGVPPNSQNGDYTFVLLDVGKLVLHTSATGHAWTIPPESSVSWPPGAAIVLANVGSGSVTIARGSGVALRINGSSVDKNVTLSQHGIATLIRTASNSWYVSGGGIA